MGFDPSIYPLFFFSVPNAALSKLVTRNYVILLKIQFSNYIFSPIRKNTTTTITIIIIKIHDTMNF